MLNKSNFLLCVVSLISLSSAIGQATNTATVKGTPYLNESYVEGVIYYANKSLSVPVRYNAFSDLIEYQQAGKALVLDASATITKVQFGSEVFVPEKLESKLGYFALLDSGKVKLYAKKKITFLPARAGGALDGSDQAAEYKVTPDIFYYKIGDGPLQEVESIKAMIATFPDKKEELTQFAKKEKISPRKQKEVLQLVQYYNSL